MDHYTISMINDMGHLSYTSKNPSIPKSIINFALEKASNKIFSIHDNRHPGFIFYRLKPGLQTKWTYTLHNYNCTVTIEYLL